MKFLSLALFAGSVVAQTSVIEDAISSISDATTALGSAVAAFQGIDQAADLQSASQAVIDAINQGNSDVEPIEPLGDDAATLAGPVQALADLTSDTVQTTIDQRPAFDSAGVSGIVLDQLTQIRGAADTFSQTVLSKVPDALQDIAAGIAGQITEALDRGIAEYQDAGEGGGSSSSTGGSSEPTSTGGDDSSSSSYPTGSAPAPTGSMPTGTGAPAPTTAPTAPSPPISTGAAAANVANFGAVAAAALLVAAF